MQHNFYFLPKPCKGEEKSKSSFSSTASSFPEPPHPELVSKIRIDNY
jgi:hypothetical protein